MLATHLRRLWSHVCAAPMHASAHVLAHVQVEMLTAQEIKCPISLEAPVCPQITPCGHVFAFPSILAHLMNHGGDNLRKSSPCPLCFQPIVARELRLVQIKVVTPPKVLKASQHRTWNACPLASPQPKHSLW